MVLSAFLCVLLTAQTTMAGQQMRFDDEKDVFFSAGAAELSYGGTMPSFELRGGKESFKWKVLLEYSDARQLENVTFQVCTRKFLTVLSCEPPQVPTQALLQGQTNGTSISGATQTIFVNYTFSDQFPAVGLLFCASNNETFWRENCAVSTSDSVSTRDRKRQRRASTSVPTGRLSLSDNLLFDKPSQMELGMALDDSELGSSKFLTWCAKTIDPQILVSFNVALCTKTNFSNPNSTTCSDPEPISKTNGRTWSMKISPGGYTFYELVFTDIRRVPTLARHGMVTNSSAQTLFGGWIGYGDLIESLCPV